MTERRGPGRIVFVCPVCGPGYVEYSSQSAAETALVRHKRQDHKTDGLLTRRQWAIVDDARGR